jgi:hypothetical protein
MSGFRPCQQSGTRSGIIRPANSRQSAATFQVLDQDLRAHYGLPRDLPHRLLTLLMKLNDLGNPLRRIKPALRRRNAAKG